MTTNYILNVKFDEAAIQLLNNLGQHVAIIRYVEPAQQASIVWLTFSPRTLSTITWNDEYALYATTNLRWPLQAGTRIAMNSISPTVFPGSSWVFSEQGGFTSNGNNGGAGVTVTQEFQGMLFGFGIAQSATVFDENNKIPMAPLNIAPIPANAHATFNDTKRFGIFITTENASTVLGAGIDGPIMPLDFSSTREMTLGFDAGTSSFYPVSF